MCPHLIETNDFFHLYEKEFMLVRFGKEGNREIRMA
jgi:hypothetical protein